MTTSPLTLYFAYGSNLCLDQMRSRCPSASPYAQANLSAHRLEFVGWSPSWGGAVATVQPNRKYRVEGMLYVMRREEVAILDRFEGTPRHYRRVNVTVREPGGQTHSAFTYKAIADQIGRPSDSYVNRIASGMRRFGLDHKRLESAVTRCSRAPAAQTYLNLMEPDMSHLTPPPPTDRQNHEPVFVYGTLRQGQGNWRRLLNRAPVKTLRSAANLVMYSLGGCPACVREPYGEDVVGEVYYCNAGDMDRLDALEGVEHGMYQREWIYLEDGSGAWVYVMRKDQIRNAPKVDSGDWLNRPMERRPMRPAEDRVWMDP
jgi:gamma-glutamylcyclotransferase (GGCT)/AIG2-like uncharacterized protein YtfP